MFVFREEERLRIEDKNPNPKAPLVRYVGGTYASFLQIAFSIICFDLQTSILKDNYAFRPLCSPILIQFGSNDCTTSRPIAYQIANTSKAEDLRIFVIHNTLFI